MNNDAVKFNAAPKFNVVPLLVPRRTNGLGKSKFNDRCWFRLMFGLLAVLAIGSTGSAAGLVTIDTTLPPPGKYVSPAEFHAYSALGIVLDDPSHNGFSNIIIAVDGADEIESFDSWFSATEIGLGIGPITLTGPVQVRTLGIAGSSSRTGTWNTEIVSMSLTGNVPFLLGNVGVQVQIDPTRPSLGQTTITDIGSGQFQIDSFFDVFTEISIDLGAGPTPFQPSDSSTRMTLVPEPGATVALLVVSFVSAVRRRRRWTSLTPSIQQ